MQIMNLEKLAKDLWWAITAIKTINDLPDAIIFVDNTGEIKNYNKKSQELFGFNDDEYKPAGFDTVVKDGMSVLIKAAEAGKPVLATASIPGREFYVEMNVNKSFGGYTVSLRDMTKMTTDIINDEKTKVFNHEKNAMLVKIESDIKSPITSISGFSRGLLDGIGGELTEKQEKYVKIINNNSEELYHFMDKFLEFSKSESSIYESNYHNFDIIETLKAISKELEPKIQAKGLAFDIDYNSIDKRTVYTDENSVKNAFKNIMEVAISMTDNGYISVKLEQPNEQTCQKFNINPEKSELYIKITIQDTGAGVSEEDLRYLCEPYAQLTNGKKNLLRAFQLGSASIMIKRTAGQIDISSEVMQGTKYTIILPIDKNM